MRYNLMASTFRQERSRLQGITFTVMPRDTAHRFSCDVWCNCSSFLLYLPNPRRAGSPDTRSGSGTMASWVTCSCCGEYYTVVASATNPGCSTFTCAVIPEDGRDLRAESRDLRRAYLEGYTNALADEVSNETDDQADQQQ